MRRRSWLAHELHGASPLLARGEKDATDEEGNIIPQQVDTLGVLSVLWGAMVYEFLAVLFPTMRPVRIVLLSMVVSIGVELFRLYHTPWLDAFRLTIAGALLLGRIFSIWNIVSYAIGITTAFALEHCLVRRRRAL